MGKWKRRHFVRFGQRQLKQRFIRQSLDAGGIRTWTISTDRNTNAALVWIMANRLSPDDPYKCYRAMCATLKRHLFLYKDHSPSRCKYKGNEHDVKYIDEVLARLDEESQPY